MQKAVPTPANDWGCQSCVFELGSSLTFSSLPDRSHFGVGQLFSLMWCGVLPVPVPVCKGQACVSASPPLSVSTAEVVSLQPAGCSLTQHWGLFLGLHCEYSLAVGESKGGEHLVWKLSGLSMLRQLQV